MDDCGNQQTAAELAEAGNYEGALKLVLQHLQRCPNDAEALNDAGAILHCLGRSAEAADYLSRAKSLRPDSSEITWNLAEAWLAQGRPECTARLFDDMRRMGILSSDILTRTATAFVDRGDKANAIEVLLKSDELAPGQPLISKIIEVIRNNRPRIAFLCGLEGDTKFLADIYDYTGRRYNVQMPQVRSLEQLREVMRTNDICWFEWCTNLVVEASKLPKMCKTVVRLHRFEAYMDWPAQVRWENIDHLVLVGNSFVRQALLRRVPDIETRTQVVTIPNGVNLEKFRFTERTRGKNLACIGYLNMRKNPMFLLQCMQKLHYIDDQYRLFFAGDFQDPMLEQYVRHMVEAMDLSEVVVFDGWQEDIVGWLEDKHFVVSTSIGESQGMGVLEAMACGLKPVIHNFPGADEIFPPQYLFNISEEFCRHVCSGPYEPQVYRDFVEQRYPLNEQLKKIDAVFTRLEAEVHPPNTQVSDSVCAGVGEEK